MAPTLTNYADIQQNEIDALRAIFMEDFKEQRNRVGAWNKIADRGFTLNLKSFSSANPDLCVKLGVTFPVTYPKTTPRFHVNFGDAVRTQPKKRIENAIRLTPSKLIGTEVVFAVATEIQDALEDALQELLKETPNLDLERASHASFVQQSKEPATEDIPEQEPTNGTEHALIARKQTVESSISQGDQDDTANIAPEHTRKKEINELDAEFIDFNKPTVITGVESFQGEQLPFKRVSHRVPFGQGLITDVSTVLPEDSLAAPSNFFVLKECMVKIRSSNVAQDQEPATSVRESRKKNVQRLEDRLNQLMHTQKNEHIANVLNFRVQQMLSNETGSILGWSVSVLVENATYGSLHDFLLATKAMEIRVAKPWILNIATGIQWLHQHGIVHGRLHPRNVLLMRQTDRPMKIKICDALFQDHLHKLNAKSRTDYNMARSTFWIASEKLNSRDAESQRPTDIWDFGVLILQMLFSLDIQGDYESPNALINAMDLSRSFQDLMSQIFVADYKKRVDAFAITLHHFFVAENPVHKPYTQGRFHTRTSSSSLRFELIPRERNHSNEMGSAHSRYAQDFEQEMRLGKGGFGAVYMARNRLENRVYAIKKIEQSSASALEPILKEVRFLSQLNHPNVVRYFTAWTESNFSASKDMTVFSEDSDDESGDRSISSSQKHNTSGLDYISSSGRADIDFTFEEMDEAPLTTSTPRAAIEFGYDYEAEKACEPWLEESSHSSASDEVLSSNDSSTSTVSLPRLRRTSTAQISGKTTLYIQMEYCKNKTLRDLINQDLHLQSQDCWRLFRQVLEGITHIHDHGIIHRDLKPENIFIDTSNNAKIGDYGLAANIEFQPATRPVRAVLTVDTDLTESIGTTVYVAPEVKSTGGGKYNQKADMYSLGVIFLEMCFPLKTGMERAVVLGSLQKHSHALPSVFFQQPDKLLQGQIIEKLVAFNPAKRPSGTELLQSGKIPVEMVDETVRMAIRGISDTNDPNHTKFMSAIFSSANDHIVGGQRLYKLPSITQDQHTCLLQNFVKEKLMSIFQRHGAIESEIPLLLPKSRLYGDSAVPLLDDFGNLLQLPYDLTFSTASLIAAQKSPARKIFTFGNVYRKDRQSGHPPYYKEVAFTILSPDSLDLGLRQAEVLKTLDEILDAFPNLATTPICYHINHSRILNHILRSCEIGKAKWREVKNVLSKFDGFQYTWANVRTLLHSPDIGVPAASLDLLEQFNFRATHADTVVRLRAILSDSVELEPIFSHLEAVLQYLVHFQVKRPIYFNALSCVNEKFYEKNFMFQCIMESKVRRDVLAAGGRFDELISRQRHNLHKDQVHHAVGFSLGWGSIVTMTSRFLKKASQSTHKGDDADRERTWTTARRCDVMVKGFEENSLRATGLSLLSDLWANGVSAELIIDTDADEHFHHHQSSGKHGASQHGWIASVKQDGTVKVRNTLKKEENDVRFHEVPHFLRTEIQERDRLEAKFVDKSKSSKLIGSHFNPSSTAHDREPNVIVITSQTKGKKTNRQSIIGDAQSHGHQHVQSFSDMPIVAVETSKEVFDGIRDTRLGDESSWKMLIQKSPVSERHYLSDVQTQLKELAKTIKSEARGVFVYNFRTKGSLYYDLGKAP